MSELKRGDIVRVSRPARGVTETNSWVGCNLVVQANDSSCVLLAKDKNTFGFWWSYDAVFKVDNRKPKPRFKPVSLTKWALYKEDNYVLCSTRQEAKDKKNHPLSKMKDWSIAKVVMTLEQKL